MRYLLLLLLLCLASPVAALTVSSAKIDKAAVQVKGKGAVPFSTITWEGQPVEQAGKSGSFNFAASIVPSDCVGDVSDGSTTAPAVVKFCAPAGPPGPPTPGLIFRDATGKLVGPLWLDFFVALAGPDRVFAIEVPPGGDFRRGAGFFFESDDCSGPRLMATVGIPPVVDYGAAVTKDQAFLSPIGGSELEVRSSEVVPSTADQCTGAGKVFLAPDRCCCPSPGCQTSQLRQVGAPAVMDLSGYVPPFHVELR